jgi:hypothetical protein
VSKAESKLCTAVEDGVCYDVWNPANKVVYKYWKNLNYRVMTNFRISTYNLLTKQRNVLYEANENNVYLYQQEAEALVRNEAHTIVLTEMEKGGER